MDMCGLTRFPLPERQQLLLIVYNQSSGEYLEARSRAKHEELLSLQVLDWAS